MALCRATLPVDHSDWQPLVVQAKRHGEEDIADKKRVRRELRMLRLTF